jgi:hypothetical protein
VVSVTRPSPDLSCFSQRGGGGPGRRCYREQADHFSMRNKSDLPLFLSFMSSTVADWSPCPRFARTVLIDGPGPGKEPNRRPVQSERRPFSTGKSSPSVGTVTGLPWSGFRDPIRPPVLRQRTVGRLRTVRSDRTQVVLYYGTTLGQEPA